MIRPGSLVIALAALAVWPRATATAPARLDDVPPAAKLWLAPAAPAPSTSAIVVALKAIADNKPEAAAPLLRGHVGDALVGEYVRLNLGRAQLDAKDLPAARASVDRLLAAEGGAYFREQVLELAADVAAEADDAAAAVQHLQALLPLKPGSEETYWLALGRAAAKTGDPTLATDALQRAYFDYPLSTEADDAAKDLATLTGGPLVPTAETFTRFLGRAEALYRARRLTDARKAFAALAPLASGDDATLVSLRLAECDINLKKYQEGLTALDPLLAASAREVEAGYWRLVAMKGLNKGDDYVAAVRAFVDAYPATSWADDALNDLGSFYVVGNDDAKAADVFTELYRRFPTSAHAERAAWKAGWWAYKTANYAETVRLFEDAAVQMRHADTRPAWMYWAAKAHARLDERDAAIDGFKRTIDAYRNTYYGRESTMALAALAPAEHGPSAPAAEDEPRVAPAPGAPPANATLITRLLAVGLDDEALGELRDAERDSGQTPLTLATRAYAWQEKGDLLTASALMKRAYPEFMRAGGEKLPAEIERVMFPIAYFDVIKKYAEAHDLDPYLMAGLINTESTFQADAKSGANAWGLMQIEPATGREYARKLGIRPYNTSRLFDPVVNTRIGMAYFADLMKQFGNVVPALASYNAGENRAARWVAERPGLARDEFIDDIPFPETQGYVKRIVSIAEDYRRLYGKISAATHGD